MQGIGATRIRLGMSQTAFAAALEIFRSLLALVETGKRTLPTLALCKLAAMEIQTAAQETLDCMATSSPADPALNTGQNHHLEILNCKIMKCRMTAAKKECDLALMSARYAEFSKNLAQVDALLANSPEDPGNYHRNNMVIHRWNLKFKVDRNSLPAQNNLRHKIAMLYAEAALLELNARSYGG